MGSCVDKTKNVKLAYIGGGSRGWAWNFMSDLAQEENLAGSVYLYDIDFAAAQDNEKIGNNISVDGKKKENFKYVAVKTIEEALTDADFVVISILPGTFDEMESDVHTPEEYGIYQSVGDSTGLGGTIRALRTLPMFEHIGNKIKECCPDAWVINYTNPMTLCTQMLYTVFPEIKVFGCCHEVFGTQRFLAKVLELECGIKDVKREEIKVNVVGVNHFTWLTSAQYKSLDVFPIYEKYARKMLEDGEYVNAEEIRDDNWANSNFKTLNLVKMDLFLKYGAIAAAGDRHLAEFCPNNWYLADPETVDKWYFALTSVAWRKKELKERLENSRALVAGEKEFEIYPTGEDGVKQIKAILGLGDLVTNVNMPNRGQIPNLPLGHVVETNACFTSGSVTPLMAGALPNEVYGLTAPIVSCQDIIIEAVCKRSLKTAFGAFIRDPQNNLSLENSRKLFCKMVRNTAKYLDMYDMKELDEIENGYMK